GLDAVDVQLRYAQEQAFPDCTFRAIDFVADPAAFAPLPALPTPDVIVFSGSLNTLSEPAAMQALDRAWAACREAIAFNFLSVPAPPEAHQPVNAHGPARRFSIQLMLSWSLERTSLITLRTDYLEGKDATIVMRKPRA